MMIVDVCLGWYLGLFLSFVGWGALLGRFIAQDENQDVGLLAGWGVACVLSIGGVLLAAKVAFGPVLVVVVVLGQLAAVLEAWKRESELSRWARELPARASARPTTTLVIFLIAGVLLFRIASMSCRVGDFFRGDDDCVAYAFFPKQIVEAGTSFQPFSHRHALSLNGQSFLLALAVPVVKIEHAFGLDQGLFVLICVLLLAGISKRRWLDRAPVELLPELAMALLLASHINLNSQFTGIAAFITLYRTLVRTPAPLPGRRNAFVVAVCVVSGFVLRPMNAVMLAVMLAVAFALPLLRRDERSKPNEELESAVAVAAFTVVLLLPWFYTAYRSDGTPLFPIISGNMTPLPARSKNVAYDAKALVWSLFDDSGLKTLVLLIFAGICIPGEDPRRARFGMIVASLATWFVSVLVLPGGGREHLPRLLFPTFASMAFVVGAEAMATLPAAGSSLPSLERLIPPALAALSLLLNLHETREPLTKEFQEGVTLLAEAQGKAKEYAARGHVYEQMQATTNPGEGIMVVTVDGYLFDSRRNPVYTPDHPGLAGPAPGWPLVASDEQAIAYFLRNGVRYLALGRERPDPFDVRVWAPRIGTSRPWDPNVWLAADWAVPITAALQLLDRIAEKRKPVFNDGEVLMVDLATPR